MSKARALLALAVGAALAAPAAAWYGPDPYHLAGGNGNGGGSGTVTSVAGSPVTTSGTLAISAVSQLANLIFAGPANGAAAAPGFRSLVATDIPATLTSDTSGNAGTATALAANPANCTSGQLPRGVTASGAAEGCAAVDLATETTGAAPTATALAADGTDCGAGEAAAGVDASGNAEGCFTPAAGITGSGTDNHVMRWNGTGAAQDSALVIDDTGRLQIGGTTSAWAGISASGSSGIVSLMNGDFSEYAIINGQRFRAIDGGTIAANVQGSVGLELKAGTAVCWAAVADATQAKDVCASRSAAGVLSADNTTLGDGLGIVRHAGQRPAIVAKTADYTATLKDYTILCDATAGAVTITLPARTSAYENSHGTVYNVKKIDSSVNACTVDGNASETIDGATTQALAVQYDTLRVQAGPTEWSIL